MPTIPQDYLAALSILISIISHRIRAANLSESANTAIAGVAFVLIVALTAWMSTGFTPDIRADVLLVCSTALSLLSACKELLAILGYQYQASSPLAPRSDRIVRPTSAHWNQPPGMRK